jgi:hypothetical protein
MTIMANHKNQAPDKAEIERYYGSMEEYQEEQRRVALVDLEESAAQPVASWNWNYDRPFRRTPVPGGVRTHRNSLRSFHFFGRHN